MQKRVIKGNTELQHYTYKIHLGAQYMVDSSTPKCRVAHYGGQQFTMVHGAG